MLYKVVLTFEFVDEILKCVHSNESYWAVLSWDSVYYAVQGGSDFWDCGWNPKVLTFKLKVLSSNCLWESFSVQGGWWNPVKWTEQYFPVVLFIMFFKVVLTVESVDGFLSVAIWVKGNKLLFCGYAYYAVQDSLNVWQCKWSLGLWLFDSKLLSVLFCGRFYAILVGSPFDKCWSTKGIEDMILL